MKGLRDRIIVRKGNISRFVDKPFNLCGSKEALRDLADQILDQINVDFNYGNIYIVEKILQGSTNTTPLEWEEKI